MTELLANSQVNAKKFVPVREAAKRVSYTTDYVGRLAREGKIEAKREGRVWLVELDSVKLFSLQAKADAIRKQEDLKTQRRIELATAKISTAAVVKKNVELSQSHKALLETAVLTVCFSLALLLVQTAYSSGLDFKDWQRGVGVVSLETQSALAINSLVDFKLPSWWWIFRYEKQEALVAAENKSQTDREVVNSRSDQRHWPAQIDSTNNSLLLTALESVDSEQIQYAAEIFSDDVLVEFSDSRNGTVTADFISGEPEVYPFRLIQKPVKPGAN